MQTSRELRIRVATTLGAICAILAALTLVWRDWIEALTGLDPDKHSGALEWAIVAGLALIAALSALFARRERRLLHAAAPRAMSS
jgi:hypothetical protein